MIGDLVLERWVNLFGVYRESEALETDRKLFKEEVEGCGLPVAPTKYIKGIDELSKYLIYLVGATGKPHPSTSSLNNFRSVSV